METSTEAFIYEIEKHPSIWDCGSTEYANKVKKRNSWENVVSKVCPYFNQKDESGKKLIVTTYQRKWKSLRDSFSRELAKQRKEKFLCDTGRNQYKFFDRLRFLGPVVKPMYTILDDETDLWMEKEIQDVETIVTPVKNNKKKRKGGINRDTIQSDSVANTQSQHNYLHTLQDDMKDEDTLFMLSLVPELKKLPDYIRLETKGELLNVLKKARFQYDSSSHIHAIQSGAPYGYQQQQLNQSNHQLLQNSTIEQSQNKKMFLKKCSTSPDSILETDLGI